MQSNEKWPTRQSLDNDEKKNSSDNFVDSVEFHLELGNMNATAVVFIAFGLFAELASIAGYPQKLTNNPIYNLNKKRNLCISKMVISRLVYRLCGRDAHLRSLGPGLFYNLALNGCLRSSIQAHSRPSDSENRDHGWVFTSSLQGFRLHNDPFFAKESFGPLFIFSLTRRSQSGQIFTIRTNFSVGAPVALSSRTGGKNGKHSLS